MEFKQKIFKKKNEINFIKIAKKKNRKKKIEKNPEEIHHHDTF